MSDATTDTDTATTGNATAGNATADDTTTGADLLYTVDAGIARITLNRPDAANALTPDQRNRLIELFENASGDLNVRVVVLTANGKHFCTGADLRVSRIPDAPRPAEAPERSVGDVGRNIKRGAQRLVNSILDCEKPVIAAVNGTAAGIGAHIALACDLIIAADTARFGQPEITLGVIPGIGGTQRLTRLVGKAKAMDLILTGRPMDAGEAERCGLVSRVVPAGRLLAEATAVATTIASHSKPASMIARECVDRALEVGLREGILFERRNFHALFATEDRSEGMRAFLDKRPPHFTGR